MIIREEAIEEVKNYENYPNGLSKECRDYIIKALEQEPTTKNDLIVDAVSRQFMRELGATCIATRDKNNKIIALGALDELPSVTPQEPILDKIRAEIEKEIIPRESNQYDYEAKWQNMGLRMALKVINKYRKE